MASQYIRNVSLLVSKWHDGSIWRVHEELRNVILWEECHERSEDEKASSTFCPSGYKPAEVTRTSEWGHAAGPDKFTYLLARLVPSSKAHKNPTLDMFKGCTSKNKQLYLSCFIVIMMLVRNKDIKSM